MGAEVISNNFATRLASGCLSTDLTITVADAIPTALSTAGGRQFRILVDSEYMIVTGVSGTTWTVTRGAEGSTAVGHQQGTFATHTLTAGGLVNFVPIPASMQGTIACVGASIEFNEGDDDPINTVTAGTKYANGLGPIRWAAAFSDGRLRLVKNAAQAGQTSAQQLVNMVNPASQQYCIAINPAPGIFYLGHITGDDPGTLTPAQSAANDLAAYYLIRAAYPQALIVLPTLPGVNLPNGVGNWATRALVNPQRRALARANPLTLLFDFEGVYLNPSTGLPVATYSQDSIHPNPNGAMILGQALYNLLSPHLPASGWTVNDYTNDPTVQSAQGGWATQAMMLGTPGANTTATGWSFVGPSGATRNLIARSDQYGSWQQLVYGGTGGQLALYRFTGALPAGAVIQCEAEIMTNGDWPSTGVTDVSLIQTTSAGVTAAAMGNSNGNQGNFTDPGAGKVLKLQTPPLQIPGGGSTGGIFEVGFNATGATATSGSLKIGRASVIRLA